MITKWLIGDFAAASPSWWMPDDTIGHEAPARAAKLFDTEEDAEREFKSRIWPDHFRVGVFMFPDTSATALGGEKA